MYSDALFLQLFGHGAADIVIETAKNRSGADQHINLRPQSVEDPGKLKRDVPSPDDHDMIRQFFKVERFVGCNNVFTARNVGNKRSAADPYKDFICGVRFAANLNRMGVCENTVPV